MLELILKSLLQSGPIGAVLAVMLWDSVQVKKKMFEVIENNTKAMTELKEEIHHQEKKKMSIPSDNTIVQKVSVFFTRQFFEWWFKKYIPPEFEYVITSEFRTKEHNASVNGARDSAHLYGLAVDFQVFKNGSFIGTTAQSNFFNNYVQSNWPGFSLDEGDHIHVNLDRATQKTIGYITLGMLGIGAYLLLTHNKRN